MQSLDPLIFRHSVLLQEILLQPRVWGVLVRVRHRGKTELNHLLAEGGDGEVEAVPLLKDLLGPESRFHVREPPGRVVCPERRQDDVDSVSHHEKMWCGCVG